MTGLWWYLAGLFTPVALGVAVMIFMILFGKGEAEIYTRLGDREKRRKWTR